MPLLPVLIASTTLLPGLWEYTSSFAGMGGKVERRCLSKAEVDEFLTDPSNRHYDCDYTTRVVGGGRLRLKGVCTSRRHPEQKIGVSLRGRYTPQSVALKGTALAPVFGGLQLPVGASVSAHRVAAACDAPAAASPTPQPANGAPSGAPNGAPTGG